MDTGVVKFFDPQKGFGFITPDNGGKDVFVHHSNIDGMNGFRSLEETQRVEYEIAQGKKGPEAKQVRVIG